MPNNITNIRFKSAAPNFERDQIKTKNDLYKAEINDYDEGHIVYCLEDRNHYTFKPEIKISATGEKSYVKRSGIGYFIKFATGSDGATGATGSDGPGVEYLYKLSDDKPNYPLPDNYNVFNPEYQQPNFQPGDGWDWGPHGVSFENKYEWVCSRTYDPVADEGMRWQAYTQPVIWAKWGTDGVGSEYIYRRSEHPKLDANGNMILPVECPFENPIPDDFNIDSASYQKPQYKPEGWELMPQGVTDEIEYEWVSERKYVGERWQRFSAPKLWSKFGVHGEDGDGFEYIFNVTPDEKPPKLEFDVNDPNYQQDEWWDKTNGWQDDPYGVDATNKYEWVSVRKYNGEAKRWGAFSTPTIWAKWTATEFVSFVFTRSESEPAQPEGGTFNNPIPVDPSGMLSWYDGIPAGSELIWMSSKKFVDDENKNYEVKWSKPSRMTDSTNFDVEFNNSPNQPKPPMDRNDPNYGHDYESDSWDGWYDPNQIDPITGEVFDTVNAIWMATTTYNNGTWAPWKVVKVKGEAGNFTSFVFTRSEKTPMTPRDGLTTSFINPIPEHGGDNLIWTDGVPDGDDLIWMSSKIFTTDEETNKTRFWTEPSRMVDAVDFDVEFNNNLSQPNPPLDRNSPNYGHDYTSGSWNGWYDPEDIDPSSGNKFDTSKAIWMATTRYKNGTWGEWNVVKVKGETGATGPTGAKGNPGIGYTIDPGSLSLIQTNAGMVDPGTVTFKCYKTTNNDNSSSTEQARAYWYVYGSNSSDVGPGVGTQIAAGANMSSISVNFNSKQAFSYYWVGIGIGAYPTSSSCAASMYIKLTKYSEIGEDSPYVIMRYRGSYDSSNFPSSRFYYADGASAGETTYQGNAIIRDYVNYSGSVYMVKSYNNSGITGSPSTNSSAWTKSEYIPVLTVNYLLAQNAKLGSFNFSNNVFTSDNGKLSMNSSTGNITATTGNIGGFDIYGTYLQAKGGTGSSDTMTLSANRIAFKGADEYVNTTANIGSGVFPSTSGLAGGGLFISNETNSSITTTIAAYFSAKGPQDYPDSNKHYAIYIPYGTIGGARFSFRRIAAGRDLDALDYSILACHTSGSITVRLPANCWDGQEYWISSANGATVNVTALGGASFNSNSATKLSSSRWHLYRYDKVNNKWWYSYMQI